MSEKEELQDIDTTYDLGETLSNVKEPDPLPEGKYLASIASVEMKNSKTGNKYLSIRFNVGTDQYPVDYANPNASSVFHILSLTDNPLSQIALKKFLEASGLPTTGRVDFTQAIGSEVYITTKLDEYEGNVRSVVKSISKD